MRMCFVRVLQAAIDLFVPPSATGRSHVERVGRLEKPRVAGVLEVLDLVLIVQYQPVAMALCDASVHLTKWTLQGHPVMVSHTLKTER
jgi:hypothetical protein